MCFLKVTILSPHLLCNRSVIKDIPDTRLERLDEEKLAAQFARHAGAKLVGVELATTFKCIDSLNNATAHESPGDDDVTWRDRIKSQNLAVAVIDPSTAERVMGRMLGSIFRYRSQVEYLDEVDFRTYDSIALLYTHTSIYAVGFFFFLLLFFFNTCLCSFSNIFSPNISVPSTRLAPLSSKHITQPPNLTARQPVDPFRDLTVQQLNRFASATQRYQPSFSSSQCHSHFHSCFLSPAF
jgi:hypothetical protein